jgi:CheY-like chemotaxis protein
MGESVLVVDDSLDNRDLSRLLLECEGFEVRVAEDAAALLASVVSNK